jgi:flagellar hook-associated protein 3 FlgL
VIARNGALAKQVEVTNASHSAQVEALEAMVSKKTDADLAKAVTDLQLSQIAVQASAQVLSRLSETSLLNYLR